MIRIVINEKQNITMHKFMNIIFMLEHLSFTWWSIFWLHSSFSFLFIFNLYVNICSKFELLMVFVRKAICTNLYHKNYECVKQAWNNQQRRQYPDSYEVPNWVVVESVETMTKEQKSRKEQKQRQKYPLVWSSFVP